MSAKSIHKIFNPFSAEVLATGKPGIYEIDEANIHETQMAFLLNGLTHISSVSGSVIAGTRTSATVFTRSSGSWTVNELADQYAWSYGTDVSDGILVRITENSTNTFTTSDTLHSTGTNAIIFETLADFRNAVNYEMKIVTEKSEERGAVISTAADYTLPNDLRPFTLVIVTAAAEITLPDCTVLPAGTQIMFKQSVGEAGAITLTASADAQTLDGTNIGSGGTSDTSMDADGDTMTIVNTGSAWAKMTETIAS